MRNLVVGGAGFIGSHFVDALLENPVNEVVIYDNLSSGREWHFEHHLANKSFRLVRAEVEDLSTLAKAMEGCGRVIHLASNPDIARAMIDPTIDFHQGTALTSNVVEACRIAGVAEILYASGSGVYGDIGEIEATEDYSPMTPSSPYGASKLAGEALLSAYSAMFGIRASAFRFGNVVGPRQTHGVGFDFVRRLRRDPTQLSILGDGKQSKSYIHVSDVVRAVLMMSEKRENQFEVFNVATGDYITVLEIADLAREILEISKDACSYSFSGGSRGWKGDVPIVRLSTNFVKSRGWTCLLDSRQALAQSMRSMMLDDEQGRL